MEPKNHWRAGRTVGRTIYRMRFEDASKADELIGLMDTQGLAEFVCRCVNYVLDNDIDPPRLIGEDPSNPSPPVQSGAAATRRAMPLKGPKEPGAASEKPGGIR